MGVPVAHDRWATYKSAIEECLKEGYSPIGVWSQKGSAVYSAQQRLRYDHPEWNNLNGHGDLAKWVRVQQGRRNKGQQHYEPDWSLWQGPDFEVTSRKIDAEGNVISETLRPMAAQPEDMPEGFELAKITRQLGPDGRVERTWPRHSPAKISPEEISAQIRAGLLDIRGTATPIVDKPAIGNEYLLTAYFIADAHLGQRNWKEQVGSNYDLAIAEEQLLGAFDEAVERAPPSDTALLAILGDYAHADDDSGETPANKHKLDVDGRSRKVSRVATRCIRYMTEGTRKKHKRVIVEYVPGNHDPLTAGRLSDSIALVYENAEDVLIGTSDDVHRFIEFGAVMIGLTHGDKCPPKKFQSIACSQYAPMWGRTVFRFGHTGHFHKEAVIEESGMIIKTHQAVTSADKFARGAFALSGRSIDVEVYHRSTGKYSEFSVPIWNQT